MAIDPSTEYPTQIDTSDGAYPLGKALNDTIPGDQIGTPLEKSWVNDLFGFQQALLDAASITASGTPDKVGASQYLDAIETLIDDESTSLQGLITSGDAAVTTTLYPAYCGKILNPDTILDAGSFPALDTSFDYSTGGFTDQGGFIPGAVSLPSVGRYRIDFCLNITSASAEPLVALCTYNSGTASTTVVRRFTGRRDDNTNATIVSGFAHILVTSLAEWVVLRNDTGATVLTNSSAVGGYHVNFMSIQRLTTSTS